MMEEALGSSNVVKVTPSGNTSGVGLGKALDNRI